MSHKEENVQAGPQIKHEYMKGEHALFIAHSRGCRQCAQTQSYRACNPECVQQSEQLDSLPQLWMAGVWSRGIFIFLCKKMEILKF